MLDYAEVEYLKWDMNRSLCDVYSAAAGYQGKVLYDYVLGVYDFLDRLLKRDVYKRQDLSVEELTEQLEIVDDMRMWRIAEAIRRGVSYEKIHEITQIDEWFIDKFAIIVEMENALKSEELTPELLKEAKRMEFPDNVIAQLTGKTEREIHDMRHSNGIVAAYKICLLYTSRCV